MRNFNILANLCRLVGLFEHELVANPEDRFSHTVDHCARKPVAHASVKTHQR